MAHFSDADYSESQNREMPNHEVQGRELQPHRPPEGITEADYETIEDAVMETARGRWFLKEFARRMRAAETASLRGALERIEKMVALAHAPQADASIQAQAREQLEGIGERLLDISWYMRERGFAGSVCASIDSEARQIGDVTLLLSRGADVHSPDGGASSGLLSPAAQVSHAATIDAAVQPADEASPAAPEPTLKAVALAGSGSPTFEAVAARANTGPELAREVLAREVLAEDTSPESPVGDVANTPSWFSACATAFVHIDNMPVRQRLALFA